MKALVNSVLSVLQNEARLWDISDSTRHHLHPRPKKTEAFWCDAIRGGVDIPSCTVWPGEWPQRGGIDLAFAFDDGRRFCVEVKGLWPSYWQSRGQTATHRTNLFYPLDPAVGSKTNTVALDLKRLATISDGASHVGLLVVGSHRPSFDLAADLNRFATLGNLRSPHWSMERQTLPNRHAPGFQIELRFWWCAKPNVDEWWASIQDAYRA